MKVNNEMTTRHQVGAQHNISSEGEQTQDTATPQANPVAVVLTVVSTVDNFTRNLGLFEMRLTALEGDACLGRPILDSVPTSELDEPLFQNGARPKH